MKQTRRDFLLTASAVALTACAGPFAGALRHAPARRARYVVSTQSFYWVDQNLDSFPVDVKLNIPGVAQFDRSKPYTMVTAVNDDGSNPRRIFLPLQYHCASSSMKERRIYLIGNHRPSACVALDMDTLEFAHAVKLPDGSDERNFGGHAVELPGGAIAFSMNNFQIGKFDGISIRDAKTLKEIDRFSSYGFQIHEVRLTEDKKYFVCGHYGSYLGQGPYAGLGVYRGSAYQKQEMPRIIYPASVTLVEANSGKAFRRLSDVKSGQEGHATSDAAQDVYLPNEPAFLRTRPNVATDKRFQEGEITEPDNGDLASTQTSYGISLIYDPKFNEVIVPNRVLLLVNVTDAKTKKSKLVDLFSDISKLGQPWVRNKQDYVSGIEFHPDGKHYILSTSDGFIAVERGTHKINPAMTFLLPLKIHSHMHIC